MYVANLKVKDALETVAEMDKELCPQASREEKEEEFVNCNFEFSFSSSSSPPPTLTERTDCGVRSVRDCNYRCMTTRQGIALATAKVARCFIS